ncbi:hypothetical protein DFA_10064 [Cavenderia fasciculata]|uniref:Reverse transcriptase domain-containing protein n=1 Tax=Cavenderia fasciculata TaxID=261658 RepID=F4Q964_CACFS|nr:uncharacterized protein DFA_10064 [Cavenderia fasciculata]EGG15233.1 hypothetical protein DFA_10064 [Cavenderia fasciculata]|eukprot:XP_004351953.1 hypothetical protein DFA_10064 [Cavenderia fasciculata]
MAKYILSADPQAGLPITDGPLKILFLQFADDSASFATSFRQQRFINSCIDLFCKATSSKVNEDKSSVILIEPDDNGSKVTILDQQNRDTSYFIVGIERYLGLNFSKDGLSSKLEDIVNGAKVKLIKWKKDSITLEAKVNILKSYTLIHKTWQSKEQCSILQVDATKCDA